MKRRIDMKDMLEKIKAVVIGHAVADALGVPVEFCGRAELTKNPVTDMRGFGTYSVPAGSWSDDTSMSVAALDSLASGKTDYKEIMENFKKWYFEGEYTPTGVVFDIGGTCLGAINNYCTKPWLLPTECGHSDAYSNGNGSLMRIHPFSLMLYYGKAGEDEQDKIIEEASALTHAHERSKLACKIFTRVLFALLESGSKRAAASALKICSERYAASPEAGAYSRLFEKDFPELTEKMIKSTGYVVDTLEAALWCLFTTESYSECVLKAVNLGGDTDTVAAVAGALAGALYGYSAIPQEWLDVLLKRDYIEEMCARMAGALSE